MAAGLAGCNSAKSCGVVKQLPIDPSDYSEPVAPDSPPTLRIHPPVYLTHLFRPSRVAAQDYNRCRQFHATRFQIGNEIYFKSNRDPFSFSSSFYLFLFFSFFFWKRMWMKLEIDLVIWFRGTNTKNIFNSNNNKKRKKNGWMMGTGLFASGGEIVVTWEPNKIEKSSQQLLFLYLESCIPFE